MTLILILLVAALLVALAAYARHDRFAGPSSRRVQFDDLGAVPDRNLVRL